MNRQYTIFEDFILGIFVVSTFLALLLFVFYANDWVSINLLRLNFGVLGLTAVLTYRSIMKREVQNG